MNQRYSNQVFKRGLGGYVGGRAINAIAGFSILIFISRRLPAVEYANYIAAYAMLEIGILLCGFGLEWVTAIYLPALRQKASGRAVNRFVLECIVAQGLPLLVGATCMYWLAPIIASWIGLAGSVPVVRAYAIVMWVEGLSRVFRDQLLACLMMQSAAQMSQLVRNLTMLGFVIFVLENPDWQSAKALAFGELMASTLSLLVGSSLLYRKLAGSRYEPALDPVWTAPNWRSMLATGRNAWIANLTNLSWGPQAIILLATRLMGAEATAALGFSRNLAEQVRKYMPMEFLLSIVRTLLVVRFAAEGDLRRLGVRIGLMYKANLLFLLPLLTIVVSHGEQVCNLLSAGRYGSAHWLFVGWLVVAVVQAHRCLTDVLAHMLGRSIITTGVSLILLPMPLLLGLALWSGWWLMLFVALFAAELFYSFFVLRRLRTEDWAYCPDWPGLVKLFGVTCLVMLIAWLVPIGDSPSAILICLIGICGLLWGGAYALRAWSTQELLLLPQSVRRLLGAA